MKRRLTTAVILAGLLLLTGCSGKQASNNSPASPPAATQAPSVKNSSGYVQWTVADLKGAIGKKEFTLVNVHTPDEGKIAGTDLMIPYDQILQNLGKLPADKGARIVLYCRSGRMSEIAAGALVKEGFTNIIDVKGGMVAWEEAGYKLEK